MLMYLGLYILNIGDYLERQPQMTVCEKQSYSILVSNNDHDVMVWHYRLDNPSFMHLQKIFPSLFNKNSKRFQCEMCQLFKHVHNSYLLLSYKPSHHFSMIHNDVWGPFKIKM